MIALVKNARMDDSIGNTNAWMIASVVKTKTTMTKTKTKINCKLQIVEVEEVYVLLL